MGGFLNNMPWKSGRNSISKLMLMAMGGVWGSDNPNRRSIEKDMKVWRYLICLGVFWNPGTTGMTQNIYQVEKFLVLICTCSALSWRQGGHLLGRTRILLVGLGFWGFSGALRCSVVCCHEACPPISGRLGHGLRFWLIPWKWDPIKQWTPAFLVPGTGTPRRI